jgi:mitogen-activated protein kinase kinase 7
MAARLQQIKDNNGKLMVNGRVHAFNAGDLRQVADLGHGTCGQVLKMQHIDTGFMLAVKVCVCASCTHTHPHLQQMRRSGNNEEMRRVMMDLEVVQRCDCAYIVNCYGYLITEVRRNPKPDSTRDL